MARPRTASDARILEATRRAVARVGPYRMTLADVEREAGITASAIVQRFGSKRALLLRLVADGAAQAGSALAPKRGEAPLDVLVDGLAREASFATPESIAGSLAFLGLDVADDAFRKHALAFLAARGEAVRALLRRARRRGDLARVEIDALARSVEVAYHGSLIRWALAREGPASDEVRRDIEAVLAPHRRVKGTAGGRGVHGRARPRDVRSSGNR
ncbi:MAG TPA: helix-turn-helix domain-containing protein [Candidatus Thermoplasmatota archaeon]|nr:helix-turn-helix domain-containing protein [Candidatus Thermoplasmatota archaeon]